MLLKKSNIYLSFGDIENATREWKRAADVDDWKGDVIQAGAKLYLLTGQKEKAIQEYERLIDRYNSSWSMAELGTFYLKMNNPETAMKYAEMSIKQSDSKWNGYWLKSEILRIKGKEVESLEPLNYYRMRMIDDGTPLHCLALHFRSLGDYSQAADNLKRGLELAGSDNRQEIFVCSGPESD